LGEKNSKGKETNDYLDCDLSDELSKSSIHKVYLMNAKSKGAIGIIGKICGVFSGVQNKDHSWVLIELTNNQYVRYEIGGASIHDTWTNAISQENAKCSKLDVEYEEAQVQRTKYTKIFPIDVKTLGAWIAKKNGAYDDISNNCEHYAIELYENI